MRWDTSKVNIGMMIMALVDCYIDDDGKRRRCGWIPAAQHCGGAEYDDAGKRGPVLGT